VTAVVIEPAQDDAGLSLFVALRYFAEGISRLQHCGCVGLEPDRSAMFRLAVHRPSGDGAVETVRIL
jgi:hypothetical protein